MYAIALSAPEHQVNSSEELPRKPLPRNWVNKDNKNRKAGAPILGLRHKFGFLWTGDWLTGEPPLFELNHFDVAGTAIVRRLALSVVEIVPYDHLVLGALA